MAAKKKDSPTSSDSSSSNSSSNSSSSSGSSSSASESSSSDSENSSTSAEKSGNPSSDSDKKPTPKKKTSVATKSKSESVDTDKSKEKTKKSQPLKQAVYSSDSDDSSPKPNTKRKPQPKPKSSATVTPVSKNSKVTPNKNVAKKLNPPRKAAQKPPPTKESAKPVSLSKIDDSKKSKTKSIFSPDNSDDSEDETPPPKLTAMKTAATKVHKTKSNPVNTRSISVSSNSSDSSRSSRSSSDSNRDSGRSSKQNSAQKKKHISKRDKKHSPLPPQLVSDVETVPSTRKLTRSLSNRKSKHVVSSRAQSETDSDTGTSKTSVTKSPVKKVPKEPINQRNKAKTESEEERKCPIEDCDSSGHLGGRLSRHFTIDACPIYHNLTPQQCKEHYIERVKKEEERKKAQALMKLARPGSPTPEQKASREKVKELRSINALSSDVDDDAEPQKDRQPDLRKYTNVYDLKLFQEAQAIASEAIEDELKLLANVRYTKLVEMGKFEMEVWYQSPYPEEFARLPKLYICEYCLKYLKARKSMERHAAKCIWRHPPGEEVYRKDKISVWEVDGKRYKTYCQNLCLLAKFFLDHKTLYYDVEPFLFYVMTIGDSEGCHTVGYFSKEKNSFLNYNVSCILTLPPYQRQGYGRLLIDFSYLLTRVENKIGSPEKPLSDLGLISYRSYWKDVLLEYLCNLGGKQISIKDISQEMGINSYDIVSTLQALGMMKYWKGKHIILKKQDVIEEYVDRSKIRGVTYKEIDPDCLKWTPFVPPSTPNSNA